MKKSSFSFFFYFFKTLFPKDKISKNGASRNFALLASILLVLIASVLNFSTLLQLNDPLKNQAVIAAAQRPLSQIPFIQNIGQTDPAIQYYTPLFKGNLSIDQKNNLTYDFGDETFQETVKTGQPITINPAQPGSIAINSFMGQDSSRWKQSVPNFHQLQFGNIFDGIRFELKSHKNTVEKIFTVAPHADAEKIRMQLKGVKKLNITREGELEIHTAKNMVTMSKPIAYQEKNEGKQPVLVAYAVEGTNYGFKLGAYDHSLPLIIDPVVSATYFGSATGEENTPARPAISVNSQGKIYTAGTTTSTTTFSAPGAYTANRGGSDIYIARFNDTLTTLETLTYLGGSGNEGQAGIDMSIDSQGNIHVTGDTASADFPVTSGAYQRTLNGETDIFITKLDSGLAALDMSTLVGGSGADESSGIALDGNELVYITGRTASNNFPVSANALQATLKDSSGDAFVAVLQFNSSSEAVTLVASTFLGGELRDEAADIRIVNITESNKIIYLTGTTYSTNRTVNFPTSEGSFQTTSRDSDVNGDAFLTVFQFNKNTGMLFFSASTFLGGSEQDKGLAMDISQTGSIVYITGMTFSTNTTNNFPTTAGVYNQESVTVPTSSGGNTATADAFITKFAFSASGHTLTLSASSFLGGSNMDFGSAVLGSESLGVWVAGTTSSSDYPITSNPFQNSYGGGLTDGFISRLDVNLSALTASSFAGGSGQETNLNFDLADAASNMAIIESTTSQNIPTTADAFLKNINNSGGNDSFIYKISNDLSSGGANTCTSPMIFQNGRCITATSTGGSGANFGTGGGSSTTAVRSFIDIPDNASFPDSNPGDTKFNNAAGPGTDDLLIVADLQNGNTPTAFQVQVSASPIETADKSQTIGLENLYVMTSLPHAPGNTSDVTNGLEYPASCTGTQNVTSSVNAESDIKDVSSYMDFNIYKTRGIALGSGNTATPVVLMSAPAAQRNCTMMEYVNYGLKTPDTAKTGAYSLTLTFTIL